MAAYYACVLWADLGSSTAAEQHLGMPGASLKLEGDPTLSGKCTFARSAFFWLFEFWLPVPALAGELCLFGCLWLLFILTVTK